ncbi:hypothetical protein BDV30DRAFT_209950 [Aspergillus minisclerotigenes]|uniref:Apple domain-containing protein n=1 Tax=Aspergillus minisclerotigenes TaxID=656917 RepID=A0A5N6J567_9EURO|nr:hypothetical protein BDV30DRAFT_209950 [Aspergillus minisclerotigenes]
MLSLFLSFIFLPAATAEILAQHQQAAVHPVSPAMAPAQPLASASVASCVSLYDDPDQAYRACCPSFDQKQVDIDGARYIVHCNSFTFAQKNPLLEGEYNDPSGCARMCTSKSDCLGLVWNTSKTCRVVLGRFQKPSSRSNSIFMERVLESPEEQCQDDLKQLKLKLAEMQDGLDAAEEANSQLEGEKVALTKEKNDLATKLVSAEKTITQLQGEIDPLKKDLNDCLNNYKQVKDQLDQCKSQIGACPANLNTCQTSLGQYQNALNTCNAGLTQLQQQATGCQSSLTQTSNSYAQLQNQYKICESNLAGWVRRYNGGNQQPNDSNNIICPGAHGQTFNTGAGNFRVQCGGYESPGSGMSMRTTLESSTGACVNACARDNACNYVSYNTQDTQCFMYSSMPRYGWTPFARFVSAMRV